VNILWARHGENVANLTRTLSHRVFDGELTDRGREQAAKLGKHLAVLDPPIGFIASSAARRAVETAAIVSGPLGIDPASIPALDQLREVNVGEFDGRSDDAAWATYDDILGAWRHGEFHRSFPGGEDLHELSERLRQGLGSVAAMAGSRRVLVVAHGANLRAALLVLAGASDPGHDLATGGVAELAIQTEPGSVQAPAIRVDLLSWGLALPNGKLRSSRDA